MKKIFLITAILIFTSFELYSQSGNSCDEAIAITAGTHAVNGINGNSFDANCTEYDAANGELEWYSYTPSQDYLVTVSTDYAVNNGLILGFMFMEVIVKIYNVLAATMIVVMVIYHMVLSMHIQEIYT